MEMAKRTFCKHCNRVHGEWEPHVWAGDAYDAALPPRGHEEDLPREAVIGGPEGESFEESAARRCRWCGSLKPERAIFCSDRCKQAAYRLRSHYAAVWQARSNSPPLLQKRFRIFERDGWRCVYCGRGVADGTRLQIDHVRPQALDGSEEIGNLVTACVECNQGKRDLVLLSYPATIRQAHRANP